VRIAICSLSQYTHVAEVVDAAEYLAQRHEVCYFVGFNTKSTADLLSGRGIPYRILLDPELDIQKAMASADDFRSAEKLFEFFFFRHAELVLPKLIPALESWQPDLIVSSIRDYAGLTAGEVLNKPVATFGVTSPIRERDSDPPLFSGVSRDCPDRMRKMMWKFHEHFHAKMDPIYNRRIRRPYSLPDISGVSSLHSSELVFLWSVPSLSNKYSPDPPYVRYVGPLSTKKGSSIEPEEAEILDRLDSSNGPRVLITLGTFHSADLLEPVMAALSDYSGTIVVCAGASSDTELSAYLAKANVISRPFFFCINEILNRVDAVVNVANGKSTLDALSFGKPLVCFPRQGEQFEIAHRLQDLNAAIAPCLRKWDASKVRDAVERVTKDDRYRQAALGLRDEIGDSGGAREVERLLENLMAEVV